MLLDIAEQIRQRKSSTITLGEIAQNCSAPDYAALFSEIGSLIDSGLLRPMGKETNGMFPPLHNRYRIIRPEKDESTLRDEILRLGPEFNPSGYLSDTTLYVKHRELLRRLREYVRTKSTELGTIMSKNERAYAIWGNEKQLDDSVCRNMLRYTGWEAGLNYYSTPEPFLDYLCNGANTETILILENKDIWFSLRKLFMENRTGCSLYGIMIDGLLYGEGKKITRPGALDDYSREGFSRQPSFYYWGDMDYEGIGIYLAVSAFPVRLFVPGYLAMLDFGGMQELTHCKAAQVSPPNLALFLNNFAHVSAEEIKALLESGKYIPQEICSYPRLRAALDVRK